MEHSGDAEDTLENLSVSDEVCRQLLRSRVFGSIAVTGAEDVVLHRGMLSVVSNHLLGRNPMVSTDGRQLYIEFALRSHEPTNAEIVRRFADGVARLIGNGTIQKAQIMQFDTSDIDHLLLPEHRSEET
jgi:hypothetical protein